MIELLAITQWGSLDFLIIDMPPGIGDITLDAIRLVKRAEFLIVTTQSKVVLETVKKVLAILKRVDGSHHRRCREYEDDNIFIGKGANKAVQCAFSR